MELVPVMRKINAQRRVGLPSGMATYVGIAAKEFVYVSRPSPASPSLLVAPTPEDSGGLPRRDVTRSRRVTATLQVGLPEPLMDGLGLQRGHFVFVSPAGESAGVFVTPQQKARLVLETGVDVPGPAGSVHDGGVPILARPVQSGGPA